MAKPELIVPFPEALRTAPVTTAIRSTTVIMSRRGIQERGYFEDYKRNISAESEAALEHAVAGVWLPIELALAHYDACDALGLSSREQFEIGKEVGLKIQGTFLGTMVKLAKAAGVTPWLCLGQYQRLYDRLFVGGGVIVTKVGPKEARVEGLQLPLSRIPYFRTAFRGLNEASCELFCRKAYVEEIRKLCTPISIGFRVSWA